MSIAPASDEAIQSFLNRLDPGGPHHTCDFGAIAKKNQGRPQLHPERSPEWAAGSVLDLQMTYRGMFREGCADHRLRALTVAAPVGAEFENRCPLERIHLGTCR